MVRGLVNVDSEREGKGKDGGSITWMGAGFKRAGHFSADRKASH